MFCALVLLPYVKSSIYSIADNNSNNTSSDNSERETELPDFSILKPFNMEPRKKVIDKTIHSANVRTSKFSAY